MSSNFTLKNRIQTYEKVSNYTLLNRVPLIITINGRSFSKTTSLLDKPFSTPFIECMSSCLLKVAQEIEGCLFGYCFNDEIVLVLKNDTNDGNDSWYNNEIQKIVSVIASITTLQFNNYAKTSELNILGDAIFLANVFAVPYIMEAVNVLVAKQQLAFQKAVQFACFYELLKKFNKNDIREMLSGTNTDEKINLLQQEANIDFNEYSPIFKRGVACYRAPSLLEYNGEEIVKNKWKLDLDLPIYTKDHSFLSSILKNGSDIFRKSE